MSVTYFRVVPPAVTERETRSLRHNSPVRASRRREPGLQAPFLCRFQHFQKEKPCQAEGLKDGEPGRCLRRVWDAPGPSRSPTATRLTGAAQGSLTVPESKLSSHRWTRSRTHALTHTAARGAKLDPRHA